MIFFFSSLLLFLFFSLAVFRLDIIPRMDLFFYDFFSSFVSDPWLKFNRFFTFFGEWWTLMGMAGVGLMIAVWRRKILYGCFYFVWMAVGLEINSLLKQFFEKARPDFFDPSIVLPSYAYPSGHAFGVLIFYLMTGYLLAFIGANDLRKFFRKIAAVLVILVSISRLALGVHWASDVVGGLLAGLVWVALFKMLLDKAKNSALPIFWRGAWGHRRCGQKFQRYE